VLVLRNCEAEVVTTHHLKGMLVKIFCIKYEVVMNMKRGR
jgi:hypothetical protein